MKAFVAILLLFCFTIQSCQEEKSERIEAVQVFSDERSHALLGEMHNNYLEETLVNFSNYQAPNERSLQAELYNIFLNSNTPDLSFDQKKAILDEVVSQSFDYNLDQVRRSNLNNAAKEIIESVNNEAALIRDYSSFAQYLDGEIAKSRSTLSGKDLDTTLAFLEVMKSSAYFWLPTDKGGSGVGYQLLKKYNKIPQNIGRSIIAADAMSAAGAFIGGGFGAAFVAVVNPAAFFFGVGFAAAWGSATAALM